MPASTSEGTGHGSAADILPKIYNGVVKGENIQDGSITSADIAPGAVSNEGAVKVVNMTYSATLDTDAAAGDIFNVTLTGNATLANPSNPTDGKTIRWRIRQDGTGNRAVTLGNKFAIPFSATSPLPFSTAANRMDILAATYHAGRDRWDIIAFVMGY